MRATVTLINALRKAADRIETEPSAYDWYVGRQCNCGILAEEVTGAKVAMTGSWWRSAEDALQCQQTGRPIEEVFSKLEAIGLSLEAIHDIEWLGNDEVLSRIGLKSASCCSGRRCAGQDQNGRGQYTIPKYVIAYFRAQADILEERLGDNFETRPLTLTPAKEQVSA